jgi:hypothetical protein
MLEAILFFCAGIAVDRLYPTPVSFVIAKIKGWFKAAKGSTDTTPKE